MVKLHLREEYRPIISQELEPNGTRVHMRRANDNLTWCNRDQTKVRITAHRGSVDCYWCILALNN